MIEILGYITLYLIVGVVLLPLYMEIVKEDTPGEDKEKTDLIIFIAIWPMALPLFIAIVLIFGWGELKNYK